MQLNGHVAFQAESQHLYQQQASQQVNDTNKGQNTYFGYLASYNPQTGYGTVTNPLNCDDNGNCVVTGPMPIITSWIGTGNGQNPITGGTEPWGIQIAYFGGSAAQNINGGEQVLVLQARPETGYGAIGFLIPNNLALPPGGNQIPIIGQQIQPGEIVIVTPAQSVVYLDAEGSMHVYQQQVNNAGGNLKAGVQGGIQIQTTNGPVLVNDPVPGDINLEALNNMSLISDTGNITETSAAGNILQTAPTGNILVQAGQQIAIGAGLNVEIDANGIIQISAPIVNAGDPALTYLPLITAFFLTLYSTHTHSGVTSGVDTTGPPDVIPQPVYPVITQSLNAN